MDIDITCTECGWFVDDKAGVICSRCLDAMTEQRDETREALAAAESRWDALRGWLGDERERSYGDPITAAEVLAKMAELEGDK